MENMYKFTFEKLDVWILSKNLVLDIYNLTSKFPDEEIYALTSQLKRAVISISSNLAEGSARTSLKDQAHFSQLAYSSLMEVLCQIILAYELKYIDENNLNSAKEKIRTISNKINSLRKSQLERAKGVEGLKG